jgi:leucyl-tRNA synthetase
MAVPAHDARDLKFAKTMKLSIRKVVKGGEEGEGVYSGPGSLVESGTFTGGCTKSFAHIS